MMDSTKNTTDSVNKVTELVDKTTDWFLEPSSSVSFLIGIGLCIAIFLYVYRKKIKWPTKNPFKKEPKNEDKDEKKAEQKEKERRSPLATLLTLIVLVFFGYLLVWVVMTTLDYTKKEDTKNIVATAKGAIEERASSLSPTPPITNKDRIVPVPTWTKKKDTTVYLLRGDVHEIILESTADSLYVYSTYENETVFIGRNEFDVTVFAPGEPRVATKYDIYYKFIAELGDDTLHYEVYER